MFYTYCTVYFHPICLSIYTGSCIASHAPTTTFLSRYRSYRLQYIAVATSTTVGYARGAGDWFIGVPRDSGVLQKYTRQCRHSLSARLTPLAEAGDTLIRGPPCMGTRWGLGWVCSRLAAGAGSTCHAVTQLVMVVLLCINNKCECNLP